MRRTLPLALVCAALAVSFLVVRAGNADRRRAVGTPATPASRSAPAERPADGTCRQLPLPVPPDRLALVGTRLLVASDQARGVGIVDTRACRWLGMAVRLPSRATVTPPAPQAGVVKGPDRPHGLAADRHSLWVVGELTLYRYDLATRRLTARLPLPGLALVLDRGVLWAANLAEGPTFIYGIDATAGTIRSKRPGDTEILAMAAGAGAVWAVSHDRARLLRIDPNSGRVARRIALPSDPHGVAFGSGFVWVALYHQSEILRIDPASNRISGPPIRVGFRTRGRPRDLVAVADTAWVGTTEPNELVRLTSSATR